MTEVKSFGVNLALVKLNMYIFIFTIKWNNSNQTFILAKGKGKIAEQKETELETNNAEKQR